jgi:hypothetical protein
MENEDKFIQCQHVIPLLTMLLNHLNNTHMQQGGLDSNE